MAPAQPANEATLSQVGPSREQGQYAQVGEENWDEDQLEKAMNTLKEMHIQLRDLRTTIPRILAPLATQHSSPEALFREFEASKTIGNMEVKQFRKLMESPENRKVLNYASKSRSDRPKEIAPWKITEHPDWYTREPPA